MDRASKIFLRQMNYNEVRDFRSRTNTHKHYVGQLIALHGYKKCFLEATYAHISLSYHDFQC